MLTIRNYTDTRCEYEMSKTRLNLLLDKKEQLYCKYFPLTPRLKEVDVLGGTQNNDKMAEYVHELHELDIGTGKSLAEEIIYQQEHISKIKRYLNTMENTLGKMSGLEYQLYYEIVIRGVGISRAVDNIASISGKDTSTIWKNYYTKIKKDVKKVANFTNSNKSPVKVE